MTTRLDGRVALITGAARGQGRAHAIRMAELGADIIAIDICREVESTRGFSAPATSEDLAETVRQVEALDRRIVAYETDVRDIDALTRAVNDGAAQLGGINIVVANAGIVTFTGHTEDIDELSWNELMDINVTGVWHTYKAAAPHLIAGGAGGSVAIISSLAGFKGLGLAAYTTTKHALSGLMKVLVNELGPHGIRVNTIHPNAINTAMVKNQAMFKLFRPDLDEPTEDDVKAAFEGLNPMGVAWIEPVHVANLVAWLASEEAYYISGAQIPVDAGASVH